MMESIVAEMIVNACSVSLPGGLGNPLIAFFIWMRLQYQGYQPTGYTASVFQGGRAPWGDSPD